MTYIMHFTCQAIGNAHPKQNNRIEENSVGSPMLQKRNACSAAIYQTSDSAFEDDMYKFYKKWKEKQNCIIKLCGTN